MPDFPCCLVDNLGLLFVDCSSLLLLPIIFQLYEKLLSFLPYLSVKKRLSEAISSMDDFLRINS